MDFFKICSPLLQESEPEGAVNTDLGYVRPYVFCANCEGSATHLPHAGPVLFAPYDDCWTVLQRIPVAIALYLLKTTFHVSSMG